MRKLVLILATASLVTAAAADWQTVASWDAENGNDDKASLTSLMYEVRNDMDVWEDKSDHVLWREGEQGNDGNSNYLKYRKSLNSGSVSSNTGNARLNLHFEGDSYEQSGVAFYVEDVNGNKYNLFCDSDAEMNNGYNCQEQDEGGDFTWNNQRSVDTGGTELDRFYITSAMDDNGRGDSSRLYSFEIEVQTNSDPVADFSYSPSKPLVGETVEFDGTGSYDSDGSIESYDWDFGDGSTATGPQPSHSYGSEGVYSVTLTVTDDGGATTSQTQQIEVNQPPNPDFSYSPSNPQDGDTVSFTDQSTDDESIVDHSWNFGDGSSSSQENPDHLYENPGSYDVTLTVTDSDGESRSTTETIEVSNAAPEVPKDPAPSNGASRVTLPVDLGAYYSDPDGDSGTIEFYLGSTRDGSNKIASCSTSDESRCSIDFSAASNGQTYSWYARAVDNDGATSSYSDVWSFTTNYRPYTDDRNPPDQKKVTVKQPEVNATYEDQNTGDSGTLSFYRSNGDQIGSCQANRGERCSFVYDSATEVGKTYEWYAVTDDGDATRQSKTMRFTLNHKPTADAPNPSDDAVDVPIEPRISARYLNQDTDEAGTMYFFQEKAGEDEFIGSCSQADSGGALANNKQCGVTFSSADSYSTSYSWYVKASDGTENGTSSTWSFTTNVRPSSINALPTGTGIDPDPDPYLRADYYDPYGDDGSMEIQVEQNPDTTEVNYVTAKTCTGRSADQNPNDGDRECRVQVDVNDFDETVQWRTIVREDNSDASRTQEYDFKTRTFTSTDPTYERVELTFAEGRSSLETFRGSSQTAELVVENPKGKKNLKAWINDGRGFAGFADGDLSKTFDMQKGDRTFLVRMEPDYVGERQVRVTVNNTDLGLTESREVTLESKEYYTGAPVAPPENSQVRQVPGIGLINLLLLALASSAYFLRL